MGSQRLLSAIQAFCPQGKDQHEAAACHEAYPCTLSSPKNPTVHKGLNIRSLAALYCFHIRYCYACSFLFVTPVTLIVISGLVMMM